MITFDEAKELTIVKWKWFSGHGRQEEESTLKHYDRMLGAHPELRKILSNCGFCEKFLVWHIERERRICTPGCPMMVEDEKCTNSSHPYANWTVEANAELSKEKALVVLKIAKAAKEIRT